MSSAAGCHCRGQHSEKTTKTGEKCAGQKHKGHIYAKNTKTKRKYQQQHEGHDKKYSGGLILLFEIGKSAFPNIAGDPANLRASGILFFNPYIQE